jgi:hypothetical protein
MSFVQDNTKAIRGNIISHTSTTRLRFQKGRGQNDVYTMTESPTLPQKDVQFILGYKGVCDAID